MRPVNLERQVSWELKQLPSVRAPETLFPRVMASVQAWALRPWYERAWFTWPLHWQLASVAGLVLCVVGSALWLPGLLAATDARLSALAVRIGAELPDMGGRIEAMRLAARVLWRTLVHPVLVYACVLVALMTAACATLAVALGRAVSGRALHS